MTKKARTAPAPTVEAEQVKPPKVTEATRYGWMGERIEFTPAEGYALFEEYRQAALALHQAKERAFAAEERIKQAMQGYEHLVIDGEIKVSWVWQTLTRFRKSDMPQSLIEKYTERIPNGKRVFNAKGVVGVD